MNQNQFDDRTQNQKQKEFDGHIFRLLELIENMEQVRDGEYKESCDIFMELIKLFKETKQEIIHTTVYQTMIRRRIRSVGEGRYLNEMEKLYDDTYERCQKCSTMVKVTYMDKHMKSKKCCMTHEAKFQTHNIGVVRDDRIANRMIYASTLKFNVCNFGNMKIGKIPKDQLKILLPNYEELFNECITEQEQKAFKHRPLYTFH